MVAHQAPLSMEFCRQEQWSGLPFPSSEDLPNPGLLYSRQIICVAGQTPKRFFVQAPKKSCNIQSGLPGGSVVNNPPAMQETWVLSLGPGDPLEEGMAIPLQYSCLQNPHGQRNLVGCSPWGHKESDTTERLSTYAWLSNIPLYIWDMTDRI